MTSPGVIAITGASGMVGGHLVRAFHDAGWTVRALQRQPAEGDDGPRLTRHRADLPDHLETATLEGVDVLIHAAWDTRPVDRAAANRTNRDGTRLVVERARAAGVERLIFVSSVSATEDAISEYGRSKYAMESLFDGPRDVVVRPGLVLAAHGGLFGRLRDTVAHARVVPLFGGGRQIMQTIHVTDLESAFARIVEREVHGRFTLAEPDGLTFRGFLEEIAARLGRRLRAVPVPYGPALLALRTFERLGVRPPVSSENLLGLKAMQPVPTRDDLVRLGLEVRSARASLDDLMTDVSR